MMDIEDYHKIGNEHLDLDAGYYSDIGIGDYVIDRLLWDTIAVDVIVDNEVREKNGIYIATNQDVMAWRKCRVVMVGDDAKMCKPGDIVLIPNSKGIDAGSVTVSNHDGTVTRYNNVTIVAQSRIIAILREPQAVK